MWFSGKLGVSSAASESRFAGRLAIAVVVTSFTMLGLTAALDGLFDSRHGARFSELLALFGVPVAGVLVARALLRDAGYVYDIGLLGATYAGLIVGFSTRPWNFWHPPLSNTLWMAAWVFAATYLGTLPSRVNPVHSRAPRAVVGATLLIPAADVVTRAVAGRSINGWPRSTRLDLGDYLILGLFLTTVIVSANDIWRSKRRSSKSS